MPDPGKEKLGIQEENCKVFDKSDGTEIDDDECLLAYDKGTVFILGNAWKPDTVAPHIHPETEPEVEKYTYAESEIDLAITKEAATCVGGLGETEQMEEMSDGDVFDIQEEVKGSPWNPAIEAEQDNQTGTDHKDEDKTDSIDIPGEAAGKKNFTSSFKYYV